MGYLYKNMPPECGGGEGAFPTIVPWGELRLTGAWLSKLNSEPSVYLGESQSDFSGSWSLRKNVPWGGMSPVGAQGPWGTASDAFGCLFPLIHLCSTGLGREMVESPRELELELGLGLVWSCL